jgi:hypothetical protein
LECAIESSSSDSSESVGNFSSESSSESSFDAIIGECTSPCDLYIKIQAALGQSPEITARLIVRDVDGVVLDTGHVSFAYPGVEYNLTDLTCPVSICLEGKQGFRGSIVAYGCGLTIQEALNFLADGEECWEPEFFQSSSSSSPGVDPESESSSSSFGYSESSSSSELGGGDPAAKVCATVNGFVDPPDIIIRVSNLGATETVNWCGETWNLGAGGDDGKEFRVCPGYYNEDGSIYHQWNVATTGINNGGIYLGRVFASFTSTRRNFIYFYWSGLGGPTLTDFKDPGTSFFDLGIINGVPIPTSGDRLITVVGDPDVYFGSYTDAGNRTFSWRRGDKWPAS